MNISHNDLAAVCAALTLAIVEACAPDAVESALNRVQTSIQATTHTLPEAAQKTFAVMLSVLQESTPNLKPLN